MFNLFIVLTTLILPINGEFRCPVKCVCTTDADGVRVQCRDKLFEPKDLEPQDSLHLISQLDVSGNNIFSLDHINFHNMTRLKSLDLSQNNIRRIDSNIFNPLSELRKLNLSQNQIVHLKQNVFQSMKSLKVLDISSNPLACNCDMVWLIPWAQNASVRLQPAPKCGTPFKNTMLKKLRVGVDLHCASAGESSAQLQLIPATNQVLFQGDSLRLRCRAPRIAVGNIRESEDVHIRSHIFWRWSSGQTVRGEVKDDLVFHDPLSVFHSTSINARTLADGGILDSTLIIPYVNISHSGTWSCRLVSQMTNFSSQISVFILSNQTSFCEQSLTFGNETDVRLPCVNNKDTVSLKVLHSCTLNGLRRNYSWVDCPGYAESTRVLEQFSLIKLSGNSMDSVRYLKNYMLELLHVGKMTTLDVVYMARAIANYVKQIYKYREVGYSLLDILDEILKPNRKTSAFLQAQQMDRSCKKLFDSLMEIFKILPDGVTGKHFQYQTLSLESLSQDISRGFTSAVDSPHIVRGNGTENVGFNRFVVTIFEGDSIFPLNSSVFRITSKVIALEPLVTAELSETNGNVKPDIMLVLRGSLYHNEISKPIPVMWDSDLNDGNGAWTAEYCLENHIVNRMIIFSCSKYGVYAVMQNVLHLNDFPKDENAGKRFRHPEMYVYVGSTVLFGVCCLSITVHTVFESSMRINARKRQCLINLWATISGQTFIYTFGIHQTEYARLCQIFGLLLHFLTLAALLWYTALLCHFYKAVTHKTTVFRELETRTSPTVANGTETDTTGRSLLSLYFVGYGIPLLIATVGAVNIRDYSSYAVCFITEISALDSVIFPAFIIIVFQFILFLAMACKIKFNLASYPEELETALPRRHTISSNQCIDDTCKSIVHSRCFWSQLKIQIIILILLIFSWLFAALTSYMYIKQNQWYERVFSICYCGISIVLAMTIVYCYGPVRGQLRVIWTDSNSTTPADIAMSSNAGRSNRSTGKTTQIYSKPNYTRSNVANYTVAYYKNDIHGAPGVDAATIRLPQVKMYYNANQANIARKFFRKQKTLALKKHLLADPNEGNQSCNKRKPAFNPNLLSDSCNETDGTVGITSSLNVRYTRGTDRNLYTNVSVCGVNGNCSHRDVTLKNNLDESFTSPIYENNPTIAKVGFKGKFTSADFLNDSFEEIVNRKCLSLGNLAQEPASPNKLSTSSKDINPKYLHSNVSLRSQDYYAPQPENTELNYNLSELDDDSSVTSAHDSTKSIDQLYQLINTSRHAQQAEPIPVDQLNYSNSHLYVNIKRE